MSGARRGRDVKRLIRRRSKASCRVEGSEGRRSYMKERLTNRR